MERIGAMQANMHEEVRAWEIQAEGGRFAVLSLPLETFDAQADLTPAEREIVRRLLRGESNRAIASGRGTSERTVANQVASIYQKLGLASRSELAALACSSRHTRSSK
jgi:DNA-binding NarL/FixJ family response regulator